MEILKTTDYHKFKFLEANRKIVNIHLLKIKSSIVQEDLLHINPILVDPDMNVIDGQHRLLAAKALAVPIYYSVVSGVNLQKALFLLQNSKKWDLSDYINFYEKTEPNKNYRIFKEFSDLYGISNNIVAKLFTLFNVNKSNYFTAISVRRMKMGELKLDDVDLDRMHEALEKYDLFRSFCVDRMIRPKTIYGVDRAVYAFCIFYSFYQPEWNLFMEQLAERWFILKPGRGYRDLVKDFVLIYNFKRKKKLLVYERFENLTRSGTFFITKEDTSSATGKDNSEKDTSQILLHDIS